LAGNRAQARIFQPEGAVRRFMHAQRKGSGCGCGCMMEGGVIAAVLVGLRIAGPRRKILNFLDLAQAGCL